jgi:hypothetical protein
VWRGFNGNIYFEPIHTNGLSKTPAQNASPSYSQSRNNNQSEPPRTGKSSSKQLKRTKSTTCLHCQQQQDLYSEHKCSSSSLKALAWKSSGNDEQRVPHLKSSSKQLHRHQKTSAVVSSLVASRDRVSQENDIFLRRAKTDIEDAADANSFLLDRNAHTSHQKTRQPTSNNYDDQLEMMSVNASSLSSNHSFKMKNPKLEPLPGSNSHHDNGQNNQSSTVFITDTFVSIKSSHEDNHVHFHRATKIPPVSVNNPTVSASVPSHPPVNTGIHHSNSLKNSTGSNGHGRRILPNLNAVRRNNMPLRGLAYREAKQRIVLSNGELFKVITFSLDNLYI